MKISELLAHAKTILLNASSTPLLDAELLLAFVLKKPRSFLYAYPEMTPNQQQREQYDLLINQRQQGKPIAYITGHKEFWSLDLMMNEQVLIPRPETELLVELALQYIDRYGTSVNVADLGVGSGAIALALAHERPRWMIYGTDINPQALLLAAANAKHLKINNVNFIKGSWCEPLPKINFHAIISNPPYIAADDPAWEDSVRHFEPRSAVIAADHGLKDIKDIAACARNYLMEGGALLLEHGHRQGEAVREVLENYNYHAVECFQDLAGLDRVTVGLCEIGNS